ncbi:hypothetical protein Vafri_18027, partial [Volvox africanus]
PPPPPPPPSPTVIPALPLRDPCEVCIFAELLPPAIDVRPFRYDADTCAYFQKNISATLNGFIFSKNMDMYTYFEPDPDRCSELIVSTCATFSSTLDAQQLSILAKAMLSQWTAAAAGGSVCRPELEGYEVSVYTSDESCLFFTSSIGCHVPAAVFPNRTRCNATQGTLPVVLDPRYYLRPELSPDQPTSSFCFMFGAIPQDQIVPSTCGVANDKLTKVEWYANQTMGSWIKSISLHPHAGSMMLIQPSWAETGNTLRAPSINWTVDQANGAMICINVLKPKTLDDICLGGLPSQCYGSLFGTSNTCCPVYRTGLTRMFARRR